MDSLGDQISRHGLLLRSECTIQDGLVSKPAKRNGLQLRKVKMMVSIHPERRGVAPPRRRLVTEARMRVEGGGGRTALIHPLAVPGSSAPPWYTTGLPRNDGGP